MKQLAAKPLLLAAILALPLWLVFGNFLVGAMAALLAAFFIAMCHSLHVLKRKRGETGGDGPPPSGNRRS